jgi:hypothetical protein
MPSPFSGCHSELSCAVLIGRLSEAPGVHRLSFNCRRFVATSGVDAAIIGQAVAPGGAICGILEDEADRALFDAFREEMRNLR